MLFFTCPIHEFVAAYVAAALAPLSTRKFVSHCIAPNKGYFGASQFVREVVPFSEVKNLLVLWENVPEERLL